MKKLDLLGDSGTISLWLTARRKLGTTGWSVCLVNFLFIVSLSLLHLLLYLFAFKTGEGRHDYGQDKVYHEVRPEGDYQKEE